VFGLEADDRVAQLREEKAVLTDRVTELESELEASRSGQGAAPDEPESFKSTLAMLRSDEIEYVLDQVAKSETHGATKQNVIKVLLAVARAPDPPVHPSEILGTVPLQSKAEVGRVLKALEEHGLVAHEMDGRRKLYQIEESGMKAAVYDVERQREIDQLGDELVAQ
jgi:DNA-binding MarR family transcriptional regulator